MHKGGLSSTGEQRAIARHWPMWRVGAVACTWCASPTHGTSYATLRETLMMLIRRTLTFILPALAFRAFSQTSLVDDPLRHVDPMIGTQRMGHVYPGATAPFGMVQLSPDTDTLPYAVNGRYNPEVYRTCSGYQFDDSTIVGFSHTHFSGTGHSDLGDILLMPTTGALQLDPGTAADPQSGFRSVFHHANEKAEPGKYEVLLEDHGIKAELTATT